MALAYTGKTDFSAFLRLLQADDVKNILLNSIQFFLADNRVFTGSNNGISAIKLYFPYCQLKLGIYIFSAIYGNQVTGGRKSVFNVDIFISRLIGRININNSTCYISADINRGQSCSGIVITTAEKQSTFYVVVDRDL